VTHGFVYTSVGLAAGFSGLAVMAAILTPVPLIVTELVAVGVALVFLGLMVRRAPPGLLREVRRAAGAGILVGAVATLVYDAVRTGLSLLDPSPYNPFEAIRHFGMGILPATAAPSLVLGVGWIVHLVNGSSFGVIYAMFARNRLGTVRSALVSGMAWGVMLELIQSILYPGWLGITTVIREFLLISAAGHLAYGATLGLGVRALMSRRSQSELV
jgi:hypothetical protein